MESLFMRSKDVGIGSCKIQCILWKNHTPNAKWINNKGLNLQMPLSDGDDPAILEILSTNSLR